MKQFERNGLKKIENTIRNRAKELNEDIGPEKWEILMCAYASKNNISVDAVEEYILEFWLLVLH